HEPYANAERPRIKSVTTLRRNEDAILVRVETADFTDYVAVGFGPQKGDGECHLKPGDLECSVRGHGWLRITRDGSVVARGGWTVLRLPKTKGPLKLNGKLVATAQKGDALIFGDVGPAIVLPADRDIECPFPITITPKVARVFDRDERTLTFTLKNTL